MDLSSEASRGDFNETIATHGREPLRAEVRLLRAVEAGRRSRRRARRGAVAAAAAAASLERVDRGVSRAGVYAICLVLG